MLDPDALDGVLSPPPRPALAAAAAPAAALAAVAPPAAAAAPVLVPPEAAPREVDGVARRAGLALVAGLLGVGAVALVTLGLPTSAPVPATTLVSSERAAPVAIAAPAAPADAAVAAASAPAAPPSAAPPQAPKVVASAPAAPSPAALPSARVIGEVRFGFDSARAVLPASLLVAAAGCARVGGVGHADGVGAKAVNDAVSLARANAVSSALRAAGVSVGSVTSRGADEPAGDLATRDGRRASRRAVLTCVPQSR